MKKPIKDIKNRAEFDAKIRELTELIKEKTVVFPHDTADLQLARVNNAKRSPLFFAKTYFPHYITAEFSKFQIREVESIAKALEGDEAVIRANAWFKGSGKSSLLAIAIPIWAAINRMSNFTIVVGADKELAMERSAAIKAELTHNARLRYDYPGIAMEEGQGEEHDFVMPPACRIRAQGYKQAIRGKTFGPHRPRLIIVDDLESHKDTNPRLSEKKLEFVKEEAFCAFGSKGGLLIWLGNLTHSHHALSLFYEQVKDDPDNKYMAFTKVVAEKDGKSTWPEAYPEKKLRAIESVIGKMAYSRQYLMNPGIDGEVFREDWLKFVNPFSLDSRLRGNGKGEGVALECYDTGRGNGKGKGVALECYDTGRGNEVGTGFGFKLPTHEDLLKAPKITFTDPSLGNGETNDYKAVVTVAFWGGFYWIMDVAIRKMTIVEMLNYMYDVDSRYVTRHFMEDSFWQKLIREYLPQVAVSRGYTLAIRGHSPRLKKEERILALQPLFQFGHIFHCVAGTDWNRMKEQLLAFPNAGYDDGPDALAAAIEMFKHTAQSSNYETMERGEREMML